MSEVQGPSFRLLDVSDLLLLVEDHVLIPAEVTPLAVPLPVEVTALRDFVCRLRRHRGRTFFQRHLIIEQNNNPNTYIIPDRRIGYLCKIVNFTPENN